MMANSRFNKSPLLADLTAVLMTDSSPKDLALYLNKKLKNSPNYVNYLKLCEACSIVFADLDIDISPGRYVMRLRSYLLLS